MKIINNSLWLILEKVVLSISALIINSYAARYLGPDNFGIISLILTLLSLCSVLSIWGTNTLLFQRISKNYKSYSLMYPNVLVIRLILFIIAVFLAYKYYQYTNDHENIVLYVGIVISSLFQVVDTHSCYFDARLKSKLNAICNIISLIVALFCRYLIVKLSLSITWFALPYILNFFVSYMLRVVLFRIRYYDNKSFRLNKKILSTILSFGFPLCLSELSILMYSRLTNLYLNHFVNIESVGYFNAAVSVSISWVIIPTSIITSFFVFIYNERTSRKRFELGASITILITSIAIVFSLFSYVFGEKIIDVFYGNSYGESILVFKVLSLSSIFSLLGIVSYRFIISEGGYKYLAIKMIVMGGVSIPINYFFIKYYGLKGAAFSILAIEFLSATLGNYFFKNGNIYKMHISAFYNPIWYMKLSLKVLRGY